MNAPGNKITIITATIDPDDCLRRTLESVRRQTYGRIEHIVVDSYAERGDALKAEYPEVRFVKMPARGVYAALNEGLREATGDIIGLLHGNDILATDEVIAEVAATFGSDPELGFVFGDLRYYNPRTGRLLTTYSASNFRPEMARSLFSPPHPTLYVSRKVAHRVGPYTTRYVILGDIDMWIRLFALPGVRWRYLPGVKVYMCSGGLSTRLKNRLWLMNREKLNLMKRHGIRGGIWVLLQKYYFGIRARLKKVINTSDNVINTPETTETAPANTGH